MFDYAGERERHPGPGDAALHDAFHLQIRYHHTQRRVTIQVTVNAATAQDLADRIAAATGGTPATRVHVAGTPGGTRTTCTQAADVSGAVTISGSWTLPKR